MDEVIFFCQENDGSGLYGQFRRRVTRLQAPWKAG
jgi:hypothetical protein